MKVVLLQNVPGTGQAGEIKEVSTGHALNFLFPKKLARVAKESDLMRKHKVSHLEKKLSQRNQEYKKLKKELDGLRCSLSAKADEAGQLFGSVSANDIIKLLKKKGIELNPKLLRFDPIKHLGEHLITVDFKDIGSAKIKVTITPE